MAKGLSCQRSWTLDAQSYVELYSFRSTWRLRNEVYFRGENPNPAAEQQGMANKNKLQFEPLQAPKNSGSDKPAADPPPGCPRRHQFLTAQCSHAIGFCHAPGVLKCQDHQSTCLSANLHKLPSLLRMVGQPWRQNFGIFCGSDITASYHTSLYRIHVDSGITRNKGHSSDGLG